MTGSLTPVILTMASPRCHLPPRRSPPQTVPSKSDSPGIAAEFLPLPALPPGLSAFSYATPVILSPYGCTFFWKASRLWPRDMRTRGRSSGLSPGLALPG